MKLFDDPVHQSFSEWAQGLAPYGGADVGELDAIAAQVNPADDASYHDAWAAMARRRIAEGDDAAAAGHTASARACYLRAAFYLCIAYHPLFGVPVDPRLLESSRLARSTFEKYLGLLDPPAEALTVPYEGTHIPAWFLRAPSHADDVRPTILVGGGWDSTMVENHLGIGVAALERGYHVILHDGPGQGQLLFEEGLTLRHDWERVVTPVVDVALTTDLVDADRLVYQPWSLGGYMAPRVAAFEHRLAAVVADPGQHHMQLRAGFSPFLSPEAQARLPQLSPDDERRILAAIEANRSLRWSIVKRGFWTNGAATLSEWLAEMDRWSLEPEILAQVKCAVLVLSVDGDRASGTVDELLAQLPGTPTHVHFGPDGGAAQHCEMLNRSLANRTILDWLDTTLGGPVDGR